MNWDEATYGERIAHVYDELYEEVFDKAAAVDFLTERARGARALELAIGTGRIALPLKNNGIEVSGIDISEAMVARLRAKPGGGDIPVTIGDFADVGIPGSFEVIFLVFNTLFALTTQEDQLRCFTNVAGHLTDQGIFVVEAFVPDVTRFTRHQSLGVEDVQLDRVQLNAALHDPALQTITSQHVFITDEGTKLYPVKLRYVWPSEMDLMAKLAGMELRERYSSWRRDMFTSSSQSHISVYGRA
ncbi:MAG: class I SAM-dependent DNA methyltransferase [Actinomycetota bacterium]